MATYVPHQSPSLQSLITLSMAGDIPDLCLYWTHRDDLTMHFIICLLVGEQTRGCRILCTVINSISTNTEWAAEKLTTNPVRPHSVREITAVSCIQQTGFPPWQAHDELTTFTETTMFQIMDIACLIWNEEMARGPETRGKKAMNITSNSTRLVAGFRKMPTGHQNDTTLKRTQRIGQWYTQTDTERDKEPSRGEGEAVLGSAEDETDM